MSTPKTTFINELSARYNWITLIGMSGLGKSHWSNVLESDGFKRFCCDDMIEYRIKGLLGIPEKSKLNLGKWLGFPYEEDYQRKEKAYLTFEIEVLREIILYLQNADSSEKIVIDTTGSAPYAGESVMRQLKELTGIIHLSISQGHRSIMLNNYLENPRPVLWGDQYVRKPNESENEALKRSYKKLLAYREKLYKKYSHHSIPYDVHRI